MTALEIERKFLFEGDVAAVGATRKARIRQGYLAVGDREVRVRDQQGSCFLTVKEGSGLARQESEVRLSRRQFEALWPLTDGRRIEKVRSVVEAGDHVVEIDIFEGALAGLVTAEVEFASRDEARRFAKPAFLGAEVTGVRAYANAALAADGLPAAEATPLQIGAVPFLQRGRSLDVVLVTSSSRNRWILPKGQPEDHLTEAEVALVEAAEEGGVVGSVVPGLSMLCPDTRNGTMRIHAVRVAVLLKSWPEQSFRKRSVMPLAEAAKGIDDPPLAKCLLELGKRFRAAFA